MRLLICAPDIFEGDAVGNHCLGIAAVAVRFGWEVRVHAQRYGIAASEVQPMDALFSDVRSDDLLLVSYSIVDPLLDRLATLPCRKICYYHGITDPALLRELEPVTAQLCERAIAQLPMLAGFDVVLANSAHVARDLAPFMDPTTVAVIPPVFRDQGVFAVEGARHNLDSAFSMLVLGRVVPHKRVEDAIDVLAHLVAAGLDASLTIVGSTPNYDYTKFLLKRARDLGVLTRIDFTGMVDDADLLSSYDKASILLSMSRHEGFCIPALEAMHLGVPAIVRAGHAAAEVVGDAGLVIDADEPAQRVADRIIALRQDVAIWAALTARARQRAQRLLDDCEPERWLDVFERASDDGRS